MVRQQPVGFGEPIGRALRSRSELLLPEIIYSGSGAINANPCQRFS